MKYTLAIESSTSTPSVALLGDNELLGEVSWKTRRGVSERMFSAIDELLTKNDIGASDIFLFGVGLGPGNFTGLRTSLSAIQAMALPTHADIIGVSSAEAAIYANHGLPLETRSDSRILTIGDARRRRLWLGVFESADGSLQQTGEFELVSIDDFYEKINAGDTIITPDWEVLKSELKSIVPSKATLVENAQIPTAANIAYLAKQRKEKGIPGNLLQPIYMHPPVFIEPRFTEAKKRKF